TGQTFQKKVVKFHIRRNDWNSGGITKEKKSQMSSMNEQDLMREFVRELTEHQSALRSFVGYLMAGTQSAPDVSQEVNLILWEKRGQFEPGTNFRAWAFTTARYVVLGHRRRLRKEGLLLFDQDLVEQLADEWQAQPDEYQNKLATLHTCIEKLSDSDQSLLRVRYSGHGGIERMAAESGREGASLRTRLFRLRAALKQCVERELKVEGEIS
ncbi:MAG: sigma-70 family RNA polymerase sigma factor, partial [Akkermansiaceae bacterium]|nr:sigma-70 family RNA polymerase sigma factor [Akkermansiaceae bacterium]